MLSFPEGQKGLIIKNQFKAFFLYLCKIGWVGWLVGWSVGRLVGWLVGWLVAWLVGWLGGRGGLHHRTWHSRNVGQRQGGNLVNLEGDL